MRELRCRLVRLGHSGRCFCLRATLACDRPPEPGSHDGELQISKSVRFCHDDVNALLTRLVGVDPLTPACCKRELDGMPLLLHLHGELRTGDTSAHAEVRHDQVVLREYPQLLKRL